MKKLMFALMITLFLGTSSWAVPKNIQITWDRNPETDLAGYIVEIKDVSGDPLLPLENLPYTSEDPDPVQIVRTIDIPDNAETEVCVDVKAYDASGNESLPANQCKVIDLLPPEPPSGLDWIIQVVVAFVKAILNFFA